MYKLLYIDDENEHIEDFIEDNECDFIIDTIELNDDSTIMIENIFELISKENIDCIILDHFLKQTRPMLNYNGGSIALNILNKFSGFPVFLLTAKEEDAFNYNIDPLHIISKENYNSEGGRTHYIKRIDLYIKQYKSKIVEAEKRLKELYIKDSLTANEEIEEIELNDFLEKTVIGNSDILIKKFTRNESNKLDELIKLAERILDEE